MKILITGGTGFIGKYTIEQFAKSHTVLVYDNLSNSTKSDADYAVSQGAKFYKGDVLDLEKLLEFGKDVDVVIHLAAKSNVSESVIHPEITNDVNVTGTQNVLQCCIQNKIKKIIFASSAAVYGNHENKISEKSSTNPLSPYGKSKLLAEEEIKKYCRENNFGYVILRIFNVYGIGQNENYAGVIAKFAKNISENKPLVIYGDGRQTRDFVSVHDVVRAIKCAISSENSGTYNIASGKSVSVNELSEMIILSSKKKLGVIHKGQKEDEIKKSAADVSLAEKKLGFSAKRILREELTRI